MAAQPVTGQIRLYSGSGAGRVVAQKIAPETPAVTE
jgi:hypothetical protein